jgi:hypothetical protein
MGLTCFSVTTVIEEERKTHSASLLRQIYISLWEICVCSTLLSFNLFQPNNFFNLLPHCSKDLKKRGGKIRGGREKEREEVNIGSYSY